MGTTNIEWADYTFNAWRGCCKISPGCDHCYAERYGIRQPGKFGTWGPDGKRVIAAESTWQQPLAWNRKAERDGIRRRVFCGSLMDLFERTSDIVSARAQDDALMRTWHLIQSTPWLDWLILTKRAWTAAGRLGRFTLPANVWLGVSVETQDYALTISTLLQIPAAVRFVSYEPALGPLDVSGYLPQPCYACEHDDRDELCSCTNPHIDWLIAGCESGPKRRPAQLDWFRAVRDQCQAAGVPFFLKQIEVNGRVSHDPAEWPPDLQRTREVPRVAEAAGGET